MKEIKRQRETVIILQIRIDLVELIQDTENGPAKYKMAQEMANWLQRKPPSKIALLYRLFYWCD